MSAREGHRRFAVAVVLAGMAGPAFAQFEPTFTARVACARGESIGQALRLGDERKPMVIVVDGTCTESVAIGRSDVTLRAGPAGGAVVGPDAAVDTIVVTGTRVTIDGLAISGGRNGVAGDSAAGLVVRNAVVSGTGRTGITFGAGTSGRIEGCTIQENPRDGVALDSSTAVVVGSLVSRNGRIGVVATNGGSARIGIDAQNVPSGCAVTLNGSSGVTATLGGSLYLAMTEVSGNGTNPAAVTGRIGVSAAGGAATLIGGNTIADNAGTGVTASRGGTITIGDPSFGLSTVNTISGNGAAGQSGGVFAFMGSALQLQNAVITGNHGFGLGLSLKSQGQLASSTIQGNGDGIRLLFGSGLFVTQPGSSVSGNSGWGLQCTDAGSSAINTGLLALSGNGVGGVSPSCTAF